MLASGDDRAEASHVVGGVDVDGPLRRDPVAHPFGQNVARIAFRRGAYLRGFAYAFAEMLSDRLSRNLIQKAMAGEHPEEYQL